MNTEHLRGRRVLVTGATGFVGMHLLPVLARAGADITILCRDTSDCSHLPAGISILRCGLRASSELEAAVAGCDVLIHMAALLFGLGWNDYLTANHAAASVLADAVRKAGSNGPRRTVFVSSLSASGPCADSRGRSDACEGSPVSAYGWSKVVSEGILRGACGDSLVVLRPPIIYGSGDKGLLPVYKGLARGVAAIPGTERSFPVSVIHADDMAQAIVLACRDEAHGTYHLNDGHVWPMEEFYAAAARALGTRARMFHVPLCIMGATALASTAFGSITRRLGARRAPNWNWDKFLEAREAGWVGDSSRIRSELGFAPCVSLEQGMSETIIGNRRLGLL